MTDEWTFVGRKQKKSFKAKAPQRNLNEAKKNEDSISFVYKQKAVKNQKKNDQIVPMTIAQVNRIKDTMQESSFFDKLQTTLTSNLVFEQSCEEMQLVAYGLGTFCSGPIGNAIYQLACTALLHQYLLQHVKTVHAFVYDPIMTEDDNLVAEAMGLTVMKTNEQGQRQAKTPTLFFMPHCGKKLYQNVLLSNWGRDGLSRITILGNSFQAYDDRVVIAKDRKASIFSALVPYTTEVSLGKCDKTMLEYVQYDAAFNDTSLHIFSVSTLEVANTDGLFTRHVDEFSVGTDEDLV
ncbi:kinase [Thraustotheca clavata]|uniref:Kinase n=1 Tax=Thraustotheca clavata TaxID=74557 RepID=A0A1V9YKH8_9STRA|nr:kinase [Thraustotheca clavata]